MGTTINVTGWDSVIEFNVPISQEGQTSSYQRESGKLIQLDDFAGVEKENGQMIFIPRERVIAINAWPPGTREKQKAKEAQAARGDAFIGTRPEPTPAFCGNCGLFACSGAGTGDASNCPTWPGNKSEEE